MDEQPVRTTKIIFIERLARLDDPQTATILSEAVEAVQERTRMNGGHHVQ